MEKTVADFFAGIGLVRFALERVGWSEVYALDYSNEKKTMYEAHFGTGHYHVEDIHTVRANRIPNVTLAHASFPCTDTSVAGSRRDSWVKSHQPFGHLRVCLESWAIENHPSYFWRTWKVFLHPEKVKIYEKHSDRCVILATLSI